MVPICTLACGTDDQWNPPALEGMAPTHPLALPSLRDTCFRRSLWPYLCRKIHTLLGPYFFLGNFITTYVVKVSSHHLPVSLIPGGF